jgi:VIT1/CCC1 family predicted Fe2+/Mn2+ transporter
MRALRGPSAVFGSADGLTIVVGLIAGLAMSHQSASALWHAATSGGLAELVGMASGQRQSDPDDGWPAAIACGLAAAAACAVPAVPYLVTSGVAALVPALCLVVVVCGVISWLRPEKGLKAVSQTFGLTLVAGVLCALFALM